MKKIINEIQCLGIQVPDNITGRKGGAGPAEGRAFLVGGMPVNAPISGPYIASSPYSLQSADNNFVLLKHGKEVTPVEIVPHPHFYTRQTDDGINCKQIALLHGSDCLATTVLQKCLNWQTSQRCAFCGTEISLNNKATIAQKTPQQLAQVAQIAKQRDAVSHVVLTSGTADPPGTEISYLAKCTTAIKAATGLPVHVQFAPPDDLGLMDQLKAADVDTVGIHIESFDSSVLARIAPAKAEIGIRRYEQAWKRAVALFGPNQVSSFVIVGLGEKPESVVWGSEVLADLGVYPFVVPLRPIPGSLMQDTRPPDPELMNGIYEAVANVLQRKGLCAQANRAGCVPCGACSALQAYEKPINPIVFHRSRTEDELSAVYTIRNEVFVKEQGLFKESDRDENDSKSIHLVAKEKGQTIGTVRVFPVSDNGCWIGGRLAVQKKYRTTKVGANLVKEAMKRVKKKGCLVFTAHIQEKNVPFFTKLRWKPIGPVELYMGRPHLLMQADLNTVPEDY